MNQVMLVGRICENPEVVTTDGGQQKSIVTISINRPFKNSDGIYESDLIRCVLWNNIAKNTCEYCRVGDVVGIKGRLQTSNYEDEEKNKQFIMEVIAEKVTFLSSKECHSQNKKSQEKDER